MNRKIRIFLSAFIALSIAGLAALVIVHYQTKDKYKIVFNEDKQVSVKIDKVHYSGTKEGRIEWVLDAESAVRSKNTDMVVLDTVKLVFYAKNGTPYTLKAKEGKFRESTGEVTATGGVTVESKEGYKLAVENAEYMMKTKKITSKDHVEITSDRIDVKGEGLLVDVDTGTLEILKNVKAVFKATGA